MPILRPYAESDEAAALELWRRTWQAAYPAIDFSARLPWWQARWRSELVAKARIVVAERDGVLMGFVTVEPDSGYLDQLVVAPEAWGSGLAAALLAEAKRIAPAGIELLVNADNVRALRFYRKHGLVVVADEVNPLSGRPVHRMRWIPVAPAQAPSN
jgi:putative acetyltransferase